MGNRDTRSVSWEAAMPKGNKIINKLDAPVLIVTLQKGLADRQMLPLDHVIRVLEEVRQMVLDAGRKFSETGESKKARLNLEWSL